MSNETTEVKNFVSHTRLYSEQKTFIKRLVLVVLEMTNIVVIYATS